jgi:hypothetical protein
MAVSFLQRREHGLRDACRGVQADRAQVLPPEEGHVYS